MALRADDVDLDRDRGLVRRFQEGDGEAFGELYRRYYDRLERFCDRRVRDHHTAEEIAQEAFARALTALPDLAGDRRFYPWVSVIAAHLCVDWHRRQGRWQPDPNPDPGPVAGGQDAIDDAADVTLALAALARLAPRHQDVLQLREIEGWSYKRISEHFGVSIGAVETLLFRARHALRREFRLIEGGGLASIPVLGWALRHGSHLGHNRCLHVPRWVAAARHPTTAVALTASATVAAVSLALIPVTIAPPAANTVPAASAPALPGAPGPRDHGRFSSPSKAASAAKGTSVSTATMSATDAGPVSAAAAISPATGSADLNASLSGSGSGSLSAPTVSGEAPSTTGTAPARTGATLSGTGLGTTTLGGLGSNPRLGLTATAAPVAGVTNTLSSLPGSLGAVPIPPVSVSPSAGATVTATVAPFVGPTVNELTTTAQYLVGNVVPQG